MRGDWLILAGDTETLVDMAATPEDAVNKARAFLKGWSNRPRVRVVRVEIHEEIDPSEFTIEKVKRV